MKRPVPVESASTLFDEKIKELGDWRGKTFAKVRAIIHDADPEIVEEWKWVKPTNPGTPVWSHGGIVCTGETYKNAVKMTFAKGAALEDPSGLFNSSLEGNVRRAIDIHEGDNVDEAALKDLIRAAVALNLQGKSKPKPRRASGKRADESSGPEWDGQCSAALEGGTCRAQAQRYSRSRPYLLPWGKSFVRAPLRSLLKRGTKAVVAWS
jgi:hypothetical protein